jgi:lysophospholipid acyltransferase (LPLAT)-like uncharacterized protein
MDAHLLSGKPLIMVVWHERLWMSPYMFNTQLGKICSITTSSRIAYFGHFLLARFGFDAVQLDPKEKTAKVNRQILELIRRGYSIAISPDGTRGPSRVCKPFPISWARKTQLPIFCVTFSLRRALRTPTWDRSLIPLPFNRGALLAHRWEQGLPRIMTKEQVETLSRDLGDQLNILTDDADKRVGRL